MYVCICVCVVVFLYVCLLTTTTIAWPPLLFARVFLWLNMIRLLKHLKRNLSKLSWLKYINILIWMFLFSFFFSYIYCCSLWGNSIFQIGSVPNDDEYYFPNFSCLYRISLKAETAVIWDIFSLKYNNWFLSIIINKHFSILSFL